MNLSYAIAGGEEAARAIAENAIVKEEMRSYLGDLIAERRKDPRDDRARPISKSSGMRPSFGPQAIEEVLRYRSPAQILFRETKVEVEMDGRRIPAAKLVLAIFGSANRDPRAFWDPERFDIARDPNPHIAFGHGIHFCIGAALSRLEARIALSDLLARLRGLRLASDAPWQPRQALNVHGPVRLPVCFEPGARLGPA